MQTRDENQPSAAPVETNTSSTSLIRNFISGSLAGAIVAVPGSFAETAKKMLQRGEKITAATASKLFYGVPVFIMHVAPATAIQLTTDAAFNKHLPEPDSFSTKLMRSFYCGVQGSLVATFVERTIVQQQVNNVATTVAIRQMFNQSKFQPWKTLPLISGRDGTYAAFLFNLNPIAAQYGEEKYGKFGKLAGVTLSSVVGATLSHPLDTLATYIQDRHAKGFQVSILKGIKDKIQQDGPKSLMKGYFFRLGLFMGFSNAIPYLQDMINTQLEKGASKPGK